MKKTKSTPRATPRRCAVSKGSAVRLSLRPYNGTLWVTASRDGYKYASRKAFKRDCEHEEIQDDMKGRLCIGEGSDGMWTYLVWSETPSGMAHELAHVVLHVFERCGIDPIKSAGEPFCYLLGQLMDDALPLLPNKCYAVALPMSDHA
jgi:hypothetical protein